MAQETEVSGLDKCICTVGESCQRIRVCVYPWNCYVGSCQDTPRQRLELLYTTSAFS